MKNFWQYTRAERRGIVILLLLCLLSMWAPRLFPLAPAAGLREQPQLEQLVATWEAAETEAEGAEISAEAPQPFDPNTVNRAGLEAHGLPPATVRAWLSYTRQGGRFRRLADLERFRALQAEDLQRLVPYLQWPSGGKEEEGSPPGREVAHFPFDPNTVNRDDLLRLGLPARVATTWMNFLTSGARFGQADDVRRVYGLSDPDFERLRPLMQFPEKKVDEGSLPLAARTLAGAARPAAVTIDINRATAEEWQALYGIGPAFSRRIVQFRDKLGGFVRIEQVAETYGLPDSTFQSIRPQLLSSPILRPLAINLAGKEELAGHPYLDWRTAEALVRYRQQNGAFRELADLEKVYALEAETLARLAPYLDFRE